MSKQTTREALPVRAYEPCDAVSPDGRNGCRLERRHKGPHIGAHPALPEVEWTDESEAQPDSYTIATIRDITCPVCRRPFRLRLIIRGCPSGGIYDVYIQCPNPDCGLKVDL